MADPAYIVDGVLTDGEAWVGLGTTTLASDTASVAFASTDDGQVGDWSQYMDLVFIAYVRSDRGAASADTALQVNSDSTTANYPVQHLYGDGSSAAASSGTGWAGFYVGNILADNATANAFSSVVVNLFDINSGKYKSVVSQSANDDDGSGTVDMTAATWLSQAPITRLEFFGYTTHNLMAGSSFSLFGVLPRMVA